MRSTLRILNLNRQEPYSKIPFNARKFKANLWKRHPASAATARGNSSHLTENCGPRKKGSKLSWKHQNNCHSHPLHRGSTLYPQPGSPLSPTRGLHPSTKLCNNYEVQKPFDIETMLTMPVTKPRVTKRTKTNWKRRNNGIPKKFLTQFLKQGKKDISERNNPPLWTLTIPT